LQDLLAEWQSLPQQIGSLSDQAAARFDDQLQASQNMAALVTKTMATIADAAVAAQRLQQKFVQQALALAADSDEQWDCDRKQNLTAQFSIARCAAFFAGAANTVSLSTDGCGGCARHGLLHL
jgi:hypothetical protein